MKAKDLLKLIPTAVRITKDIKYEVVYVETFPDDDKQVGECRSDTKQILIKSNQSNTEMFKTFLHEVLHAISFENKKLDLTEKQVKLLEDGLFRLLKLNNILEVLVKSF